MTRTGDLRIGCDIDEQMHEPAGKPAVQEGIRSLHQKWLDQNPEA